MKRARWNAFSISWKFLAVRVFLHVGKEASLPRRLRDNLAFHQSCSDAIVFRDKMRTTILDKVVTFAGEVLFEREHPTSIQPVGERNDLRRSSQPVKGFESRRHKPLIIVVHKDYKN